MYSKLLLRVESFKNFYQSDAKARQLLHTSLATALSIFLILSFHDELRAKGHGAVILLSLLCPVLVIGILVSGWYFFSLIVYGIKKKDKYRWLPLLVFMGLLIFAVKGPKPLLMEEKLFRDHREEYEGLVDLALNGELIHGDNCKSNIAFETPDGYQELSGPCILIIDYTNLIQFRPRYPTDFTLTYYNRPEHSEVDFPCSNPGYQATWKVIEDNWFVCVDDI